VLKHAYGTEHFAELLQRTTAALERLLARAREAGVVRADVAATDFGPILDMLSAVTGLGGPGLGSTGLGGAPGLPHRYIGLILAGLRPSQDPLPGQPPTEARLRQVAAARPTAPGLGRRPGRLR
jgi:hypothetical protein